MRAIIVGTLSYAPSIHEHVIPCALLHVLYLRRCAGVLVCWCCSTPTRAYSPGKSKEGVSGVEVGRAARRGSFSYYCNRYRGGGISPLLLTRKARTHYSFCIYYRKSLCACGVETTTGVVDRGADEVGAAWNSFVRGVNLVPAAYQCGVHANAIKAQMRHSLQVLYVFGVVELL